MKAMAMKPEDRYALAGHWPTTSNGGWPTSRSPPGRAVAWRARRWLARHRSLVVSAAAALLDRRGRLGRRGIADRGGPAQRGPGLDARTRALAAEVRAKAEADRRLNGRQPGRRDLPRRRERRFETGSGSPAGRRRLLQQAASTSPASRRTERLPGAGVRSVPRHLPERQRPPDARRDRGSGRQVPRRRPARPRSPAFRPEFGPVPPVAGQHGTRAGRQHGHVSAGSTRQRPPTVDQSSSTVAQAGRQARRHRDSE